jgi:arabinose-5-phosphate isomerase
MALVKPEMLIREVLQEMTRRRAGAAVAVNADGRLAGIFTHGDFARHFPTRQGIGDLPVSELLTQNPVTIGGDKLAVEVLKVLERHRIDDLVVVDEANRPLGVVDSQDLARFKLV